MTNTPIAAKLAEALRECQKQLMLRKGELSVAGAEAYWTAENVLAEYDTAKVAEPTSQPVAPVVADDFIAERVNMGRGNERYIGTSDGKLGVTVRKGHSTLHHILWLIADAMLAAPHPAQPQPSSEQGLNLADGLNDTKSTAQEPTPADWRRAFNEWMRGGNDTPDGCVFGFNWIENRAREIARERR